jgi:hypothetical protein
VLKDFSGVNYTLAKKFTSLPDQDQILQQLVVEKEIDQNYIDELSVTDIS